MKTSLLLALCVLGLSGPAWADDPSAAATDWRAFEAVIAPKPEFLKLEPLEQRRAFARWDEEIATTALKFIAAHPADPRRWDAMLRLARLRRSYLLNPEATKVEELKYDTAAQQAWREAGQARRQQILAALDAPESARAGAEADGYIAAIEAAFRQLEKDPVFDLTPLRTQLDALLARYPAAPAMRMPVELFVMLSGRRNPAAPDTLWREFALSPNSAVRERAEKALLLVNAKNKPLELSFTALDGRAVDLAQLRGKVVLIDFWATWCGPCVAELPNVRKVYDQYHAQGFEVIGISLDLEQDRQKLEKFLKGNGMPWPQHFDGRGWKNELAVKYGINAVPAMFLLGKDGRIASIEARGPKLEAEVKRLLAN